MGGYCPLGQQSAPLDALGQIASSRKFLEEWCEPGRFPAGSRDEGTVEKCSLSVAERRSVRTIDEAARRKQDGMMNPAGIALDASE